MNDSGQSKAGLDVFRQFIDKCQWDDAISFLQRIVEERPFDCRATSKLGLALWKKGRRREGAEALERALQLDPDDGEVIRDCMAVFVEAGRDEDAHMVLESYLQRNPWDSEIKNYIKQLAVSKKWNETSRQTNDKEVTTAELLVGLGEEEFAKGNMERARVCFEMALEQDPAHAKAYNNLGVLAWQEEDLERAMSYLEKALDLAPVDGDILVNAAKVLEAAGHYETAAQFLEIYLAAHPQDTESWNDYREMISRGAQSWSPQNLDESVAEIYLEMGQRLVEKGDIQGAAQAFARAARLKPHGFEAYLQLGLLHLRLDQLQEALEMLEQARSLNSQNGDVAEVLDKVRQKLEGFS